MRQAVSSPWRNRASRWCAGMAAESGSNSGARRRAPSASVPAEIASPWPVSQYHNEPLTISGAQSTTEMTIDIHGTESGSPPRGSVRTVTQQHCATNDNLLGMWVTVGGARSLCWATSVLPAGEKKRGIKGRGG